VSAPVTDRTRSASRGATRTRSTTIPAQRGAPAATPRGWAGEPAPAKGTQRSARKAYARRDDRLRRTVGGRPARTGAPTRRAQFVLLIMVLLAAGLVATLWLSTAAAAGSYHLQDARTAALQLSQQSQRLHREVADLESAPELARRAQALGMVPVQDAARLVVAPDGSVTVVGEPRAAVPPPQPAAPASAPGAPGAPVPPPVDPQQFAGIAPAAPGDLVAQHTGTQPGTGTGTGTEPGTAVGQGAGTGQGAPAGQANATAQGAGGGTGPAQQGVGTAQQGGGTAQPGTGPAQQGAGTAQPGTGTGTGTTAGQGNGTGQGTAARAGND
jgi:hypothetical protein